MSATLIVLLALAGPPEGAKILSTPMPAGVLAVEAPDATPRTGGELAKAVHQALRRWAKAEGDETRDAAREFISLYIELERDDGLATTRRKALKTKVRSRLLELKTEIAYQVAVRERLAREKAQEEGEPSEQSGSLADDSPGNAGQLADAPARGGGGVGNDDYGDELVELIQKTIRPDTWDVNGGPSSIYYWYPGRALVVSAPGEVHEQLGPLLDQLRRAGN